MLLWEVYFFSLEKDVSKRPTYDDLLKQPFILTSEAEDTEIGVWYRLVMEEAKSLGLHQQWIHNHNLIVTFCIKYLNIQHKNIANSLVQA